MKKEQIALELTKLCFEQKHTIPSEQLVIEVYSYFLDHLKSEGE